MKLFDEVKASLSQTLYNPDYIFKDWNNRDNTFVLIKKLRLNVILKIAITNDEKHTKNFIIKIGKKSFDKITKNKKENLLFEKLDNFE